MALDRYGRSEYCERYRDDKRPYGRNQERGYGREMSGHDYGRDRSFGQQDRYGGGSHRDESRYEDRESYRGAGDPDRDHSFLMVRKGAPDGALLRLAHRHRTVRRSACKHHHEA